MGSQDSLLLLPSLPCLSFVSPCAPPQVKAVRWDHELGGQSLELRLLEHFAAEFNGKMGKASFDVRKIPESMAKAQEGRAAHQGGALGQHRGAHQRGVAVRGNRLQVPYFPCAAWLCTLLTGGTPGLRRGRRRGTRGA